MPNFQKHISSSPARCMPLHTSSSESRLINLPSCIP
uniref:Uncharacterized protein n=1 Tax=Aegilops tauschii subsp. strangulata TaxID=200361 RepID=A0A453PVR3_AEGTS